MKKKLIIAVIGCLVLWPLTTVAATLSSSEIMNRLEARYNVKGIFVRFHQTSTLKALDVTDEADGQIYIKQPGRMRWEYQTPEKQLIITDGKSLWVYRPDDNQVITGNADTFFGEGKGGAFLADMTSIQKNFTIELAPDDPEGNYVLKLTPDTPSGDIQVVMLTVSKKTFNVLQVVTENAYGDETRLTFESPQFDQDLPDSLFEFSPPKGAEIDSFNE